MAIEKFWEELKGVSKTYLLFYAKPIYFFNKNIVDKKTDGYDFITKLLYFFVILMFFYFNTLRIGIFDGFQISGSAEKTEFVNYIISIPIISELFFYVCFVGTSWMGGAFIAHIFLIGVFFDRRINVLDFTYYCFVSVVMGYAFFLLISFIMVFSQFIVLLIWNIEDPLKSFDLASDPNNPNRYNVIGIIIAALWFSHFCLFPYIILAKGFNLGFLKPLLVFWPVIGFIIYFAIFSNLDLVEKIE